MLSTTGEYALRAVLYIAQQSVDRPTPANEVAEALSLPQNYLSKTLNRLAREGILESLRGPRGGFRLALPTGELSVAAIVGRPANDRGPRQCLLGDRPCDVAEPCVAHSYWQAWTGTVQTMMEGTTVADLLDSGSTADSVTGDVTPASVSPG
jgi:Rrf2 family iron-sulfur cluster assembly transcriptional regulator